MTTADRDWPGDATLENGNYFNLCVHCDRTFVGYKRRTVCRECATGLEREKFEQAAHAFFEARRAAGRIRATTEEMGDGTREALCWREPNGAYGVRALNAAWWGWCAASGLPLPGLEG
ncbi:MAG: hypothetical protein RIS35_2485 [Pseudomonadota bacterium]